ncbi:hypothetical protein AVEN_211150-1, partial [Araneus ventricosus]
CKDDDEEEEGKDEDEDDTHADEESYVEESRSEIANFHKIS